ncbi:MAG: hypothetical protein ACXWUP_14565 [Allosphingosinicella sp.]
METGRWREQAQAHWFVLLLPLLLAIEIGVARTTDWASPGLSEAAILFDLCLFVPLLCWLCYRRRSAPRALLVRTAALLLSGLYVATWLVPPEGQVLLAQLLPLRPLGLALLALAEFAVLVGVLRLVFSGRADAEQVAARSGAPRWVARLMLLEARFWQAVWRWIRGR